MNTPNNIAEEWPERFEVECEAFTRLDLTRPEDQEGVEVLKAFIHKTRQEAIAGERLKIMTEIKRIISQPETTSISLKFQLEKLGRSLFTSTPDVSRE